MVHLPRDTGRYIQQGVPLLPKEPGGLFLALFLTLRSQEASFSLFSLLKGARRPLLASLLHYSRFTVGCGIPGFVPVSLLGVVYPGFPLLLTLFNQKVRNRASGPGVNNQQ